MSDDYTEFDCAPDSLRVSHRFDEKERLSIAYVKGGKTSDELCVHLTKNQVAYLSYVLEQVLENDERLAEQED